MSFQLSGGEPVKLLLDKYRYFSLVMLEPHAAGSVPPSVGLAAMDKVTTVDMLPHAAGRGPTSLLLVTAMSVIAGMALHSGGNVPSSELY